MLSPPGEDDQWVEKPGNPNFLIQVKRPQPPKEKEELEEEEEEIYKKPRLTTAKIEPTQYDMQAFTILEQALAPFYQFIGMLEAESGKPVYYRYLPDTPRELKMVPINYGANSREEFLARNPQLSDKVVAAIFPSVKKEEPVAPEFKSFKVRLDAALIGEPVNIRDAPVNWPDWFYFQLGSQAFRFILSSASFGALELAANELGFKLEDLVYSPHVNYMFAQFVAKKFVSPKGNAYADGFAGGQTVYRVSSGFRTTQMANTKWIMGCKMWFKGVYYADNDVATPDLDRKIAETQAKIDDENAKLAQGIDSMEAARRRAQLEQDFQQLINEKKSVKRKILKK